jgi:ssRNA-specific RNase YbeY (16S rRNA maturation enzyme)
LPKGLHGTSSFQFSTFDFLISSVDVVINQQTRVSINLSAVRAFVRRLRTAMKLGQRNFNICFVDDGEMERLNARHRGKARPTDVLSFSWQASSEFENRKSNVECRKSKNENRKSGAGDQDSQRIRRAGSDGRFPIFDFRLSTDAEFHHLLGDIVISAQTARANARQEKHSTENEIRWLILHGLLHLLGYDHATDHGEMTALELLLRERLGIDGRKESEKRNQKAKMRKQK